jgi:PAS domain S-box-containing protein
MNKKRNEIQIGEEFFRVITENSSDIIFILDEKGKIKYASHSVEKFLGFKPEELIGKNGLEIIHPDDRPRAVDDFRKAIITNETSISNAFRVMHKDGSEHILEGLSKNLLDHPAITGFVLNIRDVSIQRRKEAALRESEQKYRSVVENVNQAILILQDGKIQYVNPAAGKMSGWSTEELTHNLFSEFVHPDDRQILLERHLKRLKGEDVPDVYQTRIIASDGKTKYVYVHAVMVSWNGRPASLIFLSDISERIRAEEALKQSEMRFSKAFRSNPVPTAITTISEGYFIDVNNEWLKMFGYTREETIGKSTSELSVWRNPADRDFYMKKLLDNGMLREETLSCRSKSGEIKETLWSAEIIKINDEDVILSSFYDITERQKTESALLAAEQLYKSLTTNSLTAIYIVQHGKTVFTNPYLSNYSGYAEEDLLGMDILSFVHPDDRQMVRDNAIQMIKGKSKVPYEYRILDKKGRIRWVMETISPIIYEGNRAALGSTMDITEIKEMEKELESSKNMLMQSEKLAALGQLSAGVAHEILNPINILSMRLQLMEMMENLSDNALETLKICKVQIERVVKIARNMSQFSRISKSYIAMNSLNQIITDVLNLSKPRLKLEDVKLGLDLCNDLPCIPVDKFRIEQVILNLLNNAIDAMNGMKKKILDVTTRMHTRGEEQVIQIIFSDSGIGINSENLNRIFEPFFTTKDPDKGTGLGLSICFGIIREHNGTIKVENNEKGGAKFIIELPLPPIDRGLDSNLV